MTKDVSGDFYVDYSKKLLRHTREAIQKSELNTDRLPKWLDFAKVEIGGYSGTLLLQFEYSTYDEDQYNIVGEVGSLMEFFTREDIPVNVAGPPSRNRNSGEMEERVFFNDIIVEFGENLQPIFEIDYGYHPPLIGHQFIARHTEEEVPFTKHVPFFMAVHISELSEMELHLNKRVGDILEVMESIEDSKFADEYEKRKTVEEAFQVQKEEGVIILGNHDEPYKTELQAVRDYLNDNGYDAYRLIDLPDYPDMNWRDKLRIWTTTSRFCVLVDREPSGANNEFEMLREQETILALLRPEEGGSTAMIPDDPRRLGGSIEMFWFEESPLEEIDDAIEWAESIIEETN